MPIGRMLEAITAKQKINKKIKQTQHLNEQATTSRAPSYAQLGPGHPGGSRSQSTYTPTQRDTK